MAELSVHTCKLPDCTVAATGKCMEGLSLDECPHYVRAETQAAPISPAAESNQDETAADEGAELEMVELPDGLDFTPLTAARVTRNRLTRVIVVAGDRDSGKTTLVSSLFDKFQEGPFAGYLFAGCRTFRGLERRCFPSRVESERLHADTVRTTRGDGQSLLHLSLRTEKLDRPAQDLLLSDISGEFFRDACDSTDGCQQLKVLGRADHLALCLDGEKLASAGQRHEAFNTGKLLLQSALDAEMIGLHTFIDILFTKRDLIGDNAGTLNYLNNMRERFRHAFATRLGRLRFFEIAARPEREGFPLAYGLDGVLPSWIEDTPFYLQPKPKDLSALAASLAKTEFDRYLLRRPTGAGAID